MAKPRISTFLPWTEQELDELSAVSDLDLDDALAFAEAAGGEAAAMLRARPAQDQEIFRTDEGGAPGSEGVRTSA